MVKFPSQEWIDQFKEKINSNAAYEDAAKTWEGDFIFLVEPDKDGSTPQFPNPVALYMDLFHGKCRDAKLLSSPAEKSAAYTYQGPYTNWRRLINKEIDPIQGMMTGKFKLKGNMMKIMRYTRAAKELINTASAIPTEFP